ncbi:MAG TPA: hypothetical protein VG271_00330 [Beijerinckiaceae bacterium]|jgi:hypothetical protein|nr:hypothetical protein [Beijerinckiaceae bacterium]
MIYIEVKTLSGLSYVRGADILAVQYNDPQRCTIVMAGGVTLPCTEAAKEVAARIEAAVAKPIPESQYRS